MKYWDLYPITYQHNTLTPGITKKIFFTYLQLIFHYNLNFWWNFSPYSWCCWNFWMNFVKKFSRKYFGFHATNSHCFDRHRNCIFLCKCRHRMPFAFVWRHSVTHLFKLLPTITLCFTNTHWLSDFGRPLLHSHSVKSRSRFSFDF